jgi:hypothetical protein
VKFYVYVLSDPDSGLPFYVGKGSGNRWRNHMRPNARDRKFNALKNDLIQEIIDRGKQVNCCLVARFSDETEAFTLECLLIQKIGRRRDGGPLTNLTDGGDGWAGLAPEAKAKQFRFTPGQTYSPERNAKVSAWHTGRPKSPAHRTKISEANQNNPALIERLRRQASNGAGRVQSPEERAMRSAAQKGRQFTPEHLAAIRAAKAAEPSRKGIPKSEETKARMSSGMRARWARDRTPRATKGSDGKFVRSSSPRKTRI